MLDEFPSSVDEQMTFGVEGVAPEPSIVSFNAMLIR
jgi:hypothetical protein